MSKRTPGPWQIGLKTSKYKVDEKHHLKLAALGLPNEFEALSIGGNFIGQVALIPLDESSIENAQLIAAAPEMYEALIALWSFMHGRTIGFGDAVRKAQAALEKAEGRHK